MIPRGLLPGTPVDIEDVRVGDIIDTYHPEMQERSRYHRRTHQTVTIRMRDYGGCDIETDYDLICRNFGLYLQLRHRVDHDLTKRQQRELKASLSANIHWSCIEQYLDKDQWISSITFDECIETLTAEHKTSLGKLATAFDEILIADDKKIRPVRLMGLLIVLHAEQRHNTHLMYEEYSREQLAEGFVAQCRNPRHFEQLLDDHSTTLDAVSDHLVQALDTSIQTWNTSS